MFRKTREVRSYARRGRPIGLRPASCRTTSPTLAKAVGGGGSLTGGGVVCCTGSRKAATWSPISRSIMASMVSANRGWRSAWVLLNGRSARHLNAPAIHVVWNRAWSDNRTCHREDRLRRQLNLQVGASRRRDGPVRSRQNIPLMTLRSSARGTPRGLFGNSGWMIDHSKSDIS